MTPKRRGIVLAITLLATSAIIFFAALYLDVFVSHKTLSFRQQQTIVAQTAASAGIDDAVYQLERDSSWTAGFSSTALSSGATYSVSFDSGQSAVPCSTNNAASATAVVDAEGRTIPAGCVHVVSIGEINGATMREDAFIRVIAASSRLAAALIVTESATLADGAHLDSYSSSADTVTATGDLITSATASGVINLQSGSLCQGILVGQGGSSSVVTGAGTHGTISVSSTALSYPYATVPTSTTSRTTTSVAAGSTVTLEPGVYSSLTTGGSTTSTTVVNLSPGAYIFNGPVSFGDGTRVYAQGPVALYLAGSLSTGASVKINYDRAPRTFPMSNGAPPRYMQIYGSSTTSTISLYSGIVFNGCVYAPNAAVSVGSSASVRGAIVARTCTLSTDATVYYDQDLPLTGAYVVRW